MYHLDPIKFLSAVELAWQAALKKVKLELLTDFKYNEVHRYAKSNNK